jgi:phosphatidylserine/phosphatidylglycerophosphate/cardiolipin synthase-like enzyme
MNLRISFFGLTVWCMLVLQGCISSSSMKATYQSTLDSPDMYEQREDMRIDQKLDYGKAPIGPLVEESFREDMHFVNILETGDDALLARVYLFRLAQKSINVQTFIWSNDESGQLAFHELLNAARRGVSVNIIVDDLSLRKLPGMVPYLATAHPNIRIKQYNPMADNISESMLGTLSGWAFNFSLSNQRMHNKLIIVDDRIAIIGGRNFANDYFDRGTHRNFKDRDVLITGPVVKQMTDSFVDYWAFKLSVPSTSMKDVEAAISTGGIDVPEVAKNYQVPAIFKDLSDCADNQACMASRFFGHSHPISDVQFLADGPGKAEKLGEYEVSAVTNEFVNRIKNSEESMMLQSPYLVVSKTGVKMFRDVLKERPQLEIKVSSNSLAAADHYYAYAFSFRNKKQYIRKLKWQIFELKPRPTDDALMVPEISGVTRADDYFTCIHSKTYIFDRQTVWIGSFNMDPRSSILNTEVALIINDPSIAELVGDFIARDMAPGNAWVIGKRRRVPLLGYVSGLMENIMHAFPIINIWPFRYTTSYELKDGGTEVPFFDKTFYDNYQSVGEFPETGAKAAKTRLVNSFFGPAEPII